MKGTKEMTKLTLFPSDTKSPYGNNDRLSFKDYLKNWGFLSLSKTKKLLDPYFRFKLLSSAKFDAKKYEADKEKVLDYYNSLGYRDAQIIEDTQLIVKNNLDLGEAAAAYALHGIALNDASISVFKTKYKYNGKRSINFITSFRCK